MQRKPIEMSVSMLTNSHVEYAGTDTIVDFSASSPTHHATNRDGVNITFVVYHPSTVAGVVTLLTSAGHASRDAMHTAQVAVRYRGRTAKCRTMPAGSPDTVVWNETTGLYSVRINSL